MYSRSFFPGRLARELRTHIVIGLAEIDGATRVFYNTAAVFGPHGYIGKYRKTHLYTDDVRFFSRTLSLNNLTSYKSLDRWAAEGSDIVVFDTQSAIGRLGVIICMDADYVEPSRLNALKGMRLPHTHTLIYKNKRVHSYFWLNDE